VTQPSSKRIFVSGGTGYIGRPLIAALLTRGHQVRALVRAGSERKLPTGCSFVTGNALEAASYAQGVPPADTFVQLVGISHPNPSKARQFELVDFVSARAAITAAEDSRIQHFIYISVAHPAPVMKAYIEVRSKVEEMIRASGLNATILRPWYVLGPGHRWPYVLKPVYLLLEYLPSTRATALRLGLVTLGQMVNALCGAVENPSSGIRVLGVPEIRQSPALVDTGFGE
jgi:uncharacterized protein YbjT (DUF2867 family)